MGAIEVVPGATYSFGGWAKGDGKGRIAVWGNAYEGAKELASVDLAIKPEWTESRGTIAIPGNIRTVTIRWHLERAEKVLVDDLFFSADFAEPFDVDKVLTTKYKKDKHTLLFVDFDGQGEYRAETAKLTDDRGGRFGKGIRVNQKSVSQAVIPLTLEKMPPEGTLEFWFSCDEEPRQLITMLSAGQYVLWLPSNLEGIAPGWMMPGDKEGGQVSPWRFWGEEGDMTHQGAWPMWRSNGTRRRCAAM